MWQTLYLNLCASTKNSIEIKHDQIDKIQGGFITFLCIQLYTYKILFTYRHAPPTPIPTFSCAGIQSPNLHLTVVKR